jgi:hypothetical protein
LPVPLEKSTLAHGSRYLFVSKHEIDQNEKEFGLQKKGALWSIGV